MNIDCYPEPQTVDVANLCGGQVGYWAEDERMLMGCEIGYGVEIAERYNTCLCVDLESGFIMQVPVGTQIIPMKTKVVLDRDFETR